MHDTDAVKGTVAGRHAVLPYWCSERMVRSEVLMAVGMKMTVFWDVASSEMSVSMYQTTECSIPEDRHLHSERLFSKILAISA
jgi:hypothetical protein